MGEKQFNKALILPIVSLIVLLVKQITGYQLNDQFQDTVCDAVMSLIVLVGIFTHPKKPNMPE